MPSNSTITIQSIVEKETSHFTLPHIVLTGANVENFATSLGTFRTALDAIIRGVIRQSVIKYEDTLVSGALPASQDARRELKMLVRYVGDSTGDKFTMEIATPDLSALTLETGDANFVNLADAGVMATFVTEFEGLVRSPDDPTEAVTIRKIQIVGRNI